MVELEAQLPSPTKHISVTDAAGKAASSQLLSIDAQTLSGAPPASREHSFVGLQDEGRHVVEGGVPEIISLSIAPNQTRKVDILQKQDAQVGGIRVSYSGSKDDLIVVGGLEDPSKRILSANSLPRRR